MGTNGPKSLRGNLGSEKNGQVLLDLGPPGGVSENRGVLLLMVRSKSGIHSAVEVGS